MHKRKFLWTGFVAVLSLFVAAEVFADAVTDRQKLMKNNSAAAKAIKGAVESKDYATVELKAKDIMENSEKIVDLFPKGSTAGKTKAKAEIWDQSDDFSKAAKNLNKAATELASAAKTGDAAAVEAKVKAVSGACGGCHKAFRAEKYAGE